jgi:hypothetical protein
MDHVLVRISQLDKDGIKGLAALHQSVMRTLL